MDHKIRKKLAMSRFLKAMLLTILFQQLGYAGRAQLNSLRQKVEVRLENTNALAIITSLGQQSGCSFYYTASELGGIKVTSFLVNGTLGLALQKLKALAPLEYKVSGNSISIQVTTTPSRVNTDTVGRRTMKGRITDAKTGKPVAYVDVYAQEGHVSAASNGNGDFVMQSPAAHDLLIFAKAGYASQVITVNGYTVLDIKLVQDNRTLSG